MTYFLIRGSVHESEYMGAERTLDDIRLVVAESEEEAQEKYETFWRCKTTEYSVYYSVWHTEVLQTVL